MRVEFRAVPQIGRSPYHSAKHTITHVQNTVRNPARPLGEYIGQFAQIGDEWMDGWVPDAPVLNVPPVRKHGWERGGKLERTLALSHTISASGPYFRPVRSIMRLDGVAPVHQKQKHTTTRASML